LQAVAHRSQTLQAAPERLRADVLAGARSCEGLEPPAGVAEREALGEVRLGIREAGGALQPDGRRIADGAMGLLPSMLGAAG
jgi:hypothetical protein